MKKRENAINEKFICKNDKRHLKKIGLPCIILHI